VINLWFETRGLIGFAAAQYTPNVMPFGTPFARDGDLLNVPFIGSYIIYRQDSAAPTVLIPVEVNPIAIDAVLAEPEALGTRRSVGRPDPRPLSANQASPASWAEDLFDYITARQSTYDRRIPDVPPGLVNTNDLNSLADDTRTADGPVFGDEGRGTAPVRVFGNGLGASGIAVRAESLSQRSTNYATLNEGKVNINTAPPAVLRLLPITVGTDGLSGPGVVTDAIATAINTSRNSASGPFTSVMHFDRSATVGGPSTVVSPISAASTAEARFLAGDITPTSGLDDYKVDLANATRISNLASTRSDTFTVYITVQAWTVGGPPGTTWVQATDTRLVGERRVAFIVDRSALTNFDKDTKKLRILQVERE
jgi:hypothetical protein